MNLVKKKPGALTLTVGNYKGGVGKTTNSVLIGYTLANMGIKTLIVDLDPQANATKTLTLTKMINENDEIITIDKTIMKAIADGTLADIQIKVSDNLYMLPSNIDFEEFPKFLYKNTSSQEEEDFYLDKLLKPLKKEYEIIIIDVPPMSKEVTRNAVTTSDYVLISLQTQERSLTGAENYIDELDKLNSLYSLNLIVVGLLPVLLKNQGSVDEYVIESAKEIFGEDNMFDTIIPQMERIKRFDINGITNKDRHDKKVLEKYVNVTNELVKRLNYYEGADEIE
ncbi:ParA family protein [Enterococcus faecalis]|uniref:ParA family protein n=1 Tax=Enterococcus faecalis TaxID=1351 RepID=UPI00293539FA|nr:ParA family protein [Enterococcus faecalis]MDV2540881.1 ParA family protein [Enterococcus faecalis]MDV2553929.1 ParA family protein [Enterococcus faecalis]